MAMSPCRCGASLRVPFIKAVVGGQHDAEWVAATRGEGMLLVDAHDPLRRGGTGRVADWDAARVLAASHALVLAGGLSADNVAAAAQRVRPMAIDVSSGVESAPGVKDAGRLRALFAAIAAMEADGR